MKNFFYLLIFLSITYIGCESTPPAGSIKGTITTADGTPISGATAQNESGANSISNESGEFLLSGLSSGTKRILISKRGIITPKLIDVEIPVDKGIAIDITVDTSEIPNISWLPVKKGTYPFNAYGNNYTKQVSNDFQIMKFEVTNKQYIAFLEEALLTGNARVIIAQRKFDVDKKLVLDKNDKILLKLAIDDVANAYTENLMETSQINYNNGKFSVPAILENHPVAGVSWIGAQTFADFYGFRIPTIEEWSAAAWGNDMNYWNDKLSSDYVNLENTGDPGEIDPNPNQERPSNYNWVSYGSHTTPVGLYSGGTYKKDEYVFKTKNAKSPVGAYDMIGNVCEFIKYEYNDGYWIYIAGLSFYEGAFLYPRVFNQARSESVTFMNCGFRCAK